MDKRQKLETAIEREAYKFLNMIKEGASDAVMLWANRKRVDIDVQLLQKVLDQYKAALESEFLTKVEHMMKGLNKDLSEFTEQENPLPLTDDTKSKRKNVKKST